MEANPASSGPGEAPAASSSAGAAPDQMPAPAPGPPSRYEAQKRRDWNTFQQYLRNHKPPLSPSRCSGAHVIEFLRYLDQFGKTRVHLPGCAFYGRPDPPASCACPLRQAWGSLDALIGRLRAAYEESGAPPESSPFAARAVRLYLREVRDAQARARGIPYDKNRRKKRKRLPPPPQGSPSASHADPGASASSSFPSAAIGVGLLAGGSGPSGSVSAAGLPGAGPAATGSTSAAGEERGPPRLLSWFLREREDHGVLLFFFLHLGSFSFGFSGTNHNDLAHSTFVFICFHCTGACVCVWGERERERERDQGGRDGPPGTI